MKKGILLAVVIFMSTAVFAHAQEGELTGTIDLTYLSAYTWYGIDIYPGAHGEGATRTTLDLDLYDTGLGLTTRWVRANTGAVDAPGGGVSFENNEEIWLTLTYSNSYFEYETYATDCIVGWMYYDYPDMPSKFSDQQEAFVSLSWPEICPEGVVPSYTLIRMWKAKSGNPTPTVREGANDLSGWIHVFGLGYDLPVEGFLPDVPEQILHLSVAAVYNEGAAAALVDHDWSHAVFGVSTDFDLGNDMTFSPGVYYQSSWEDTSSVNLRICISPNHP